MTRPVRRPIVMLAVACLAIAGCRIETAGAPSGSTTLFASFDDAADLTPGHYVQASNVTVGSVRAITLDGYKARVELSIEDGFSVPVGTAAVIRRTSLLGEHYVDLVLPTEFDPEGGPFLGDQDVLDDASTQPDVEQLAEQAAILVGSLSADDLGATIDAAAEALGGRGAIVNQLVRDSGVVLGTLGEQSETIAAGVDSVGAVAGALAPVTGEFVETLDALNEATESLAGSRDRMVVAVDALVELARTTNDVVLDPHGERLVAMLGQFENLLGTLSARSDVLADLIVDLSRFTDLFPRTIQNGSVLLLTWIYLGGGGGPIVPLSSPSGGPIETMATLLGGPS